jgi:hypothetical protein
MILLAKDKIIHSNEYRKDCDKYKEEEVEHLIPYLSEEVQLSEDFTLLDFFNYIEKEKEIINVCFSSHLGHHPLQLYIDDIHKEISTEKDESSMEVKYLELYWMCDFWNWEKIKPVESFENGLTHKIPDNQFPDIDFYAGFHGVGSFLDFDDKTMVEEGGIAIEFSPLNELKNLVIKLNKKVDIVDMSTSDMKPLCTGNHEFSLYEFIGEVLSELSFMGDPEKRNKDLEDLDNGISEIRYNYKEDPEKHSINLADLKKELKKNREPECEHKWVHRTDGYVEQCYPAICIKCGKYGCACDAKYADMSKEEKEEFDNNGIPGNKHELEEKIKEKNV